MDTKKLRQKILDLAIRGKLVPQDPNDEPASVLLERIKAEKEQLIKEGKIKRNKKEGTSDTFHYRNVPFDVPEGWVWTRLGKICDYGICTNVAPTDISEDAWVLDLEDIEKDSAKLLCRVRKIDRSTTSVRHSFSKGDVLYSKLRTYLNKVLIADTDGYCSSEILPLDFRGFVIPEYARLVLMSKMFLDYTAQCGYGVKMPRLGTTDGRNALFPLPPLSEQRRIVSVVKSAFTIIDEIEANKQDLTQIIKQAKSKVLDLAIRGKLVPQDPNDEPASELLERIKKEQKPTKASSDISHYPFDVPEGWVWAKISAISASIQYGVTESAKSEGNYKFLRITDIQDNLVDWDSVPYVYLTDEKARDYLLSNNDIVFARTGATVGKSYLISGLNKKAVFASYLIRIKLLPLLNTQYVKLFFESDFYWEQILEKSVGIGQPNVNGTSLKELVISLPPLAEQKRVVFKIEQIFSQLDNIEKSLKA